MGLVDIALYLGAAFINLPGRTKAQVLVIASVLFAIVWLTAFAIRVNNAYYANEHQYLIYNQTKAKCKRDPETRLLFHDDCAEAEANTLHTLTHIAFWQTWNNSYACGGISCTDVIFGYDSTFAGVVTRIVVLIFVCIALYVVYVYAQRLLSYGDQAYKDRTTSRYRSEYRQPHQKRQQYLELTDAPHNTSKTSWRIDPDSKHQVHY